jgi:subtilisin family serine protease
MPVIKINGNEYDPDIDPDIGDAAVSAAQGAGLSPYVLIQTLSVLEDEDYEVLDRYNVKVMEYVSENTYLCRSSGKSETIRDLSFVRHIRPYLPEFKIEKGLSLAGSAKVSEASSAQEDAVDVHIVLHQDVQSSERTSVEGEIVKEAGVDLEKVGNEKTPVLQANKVERKRLQAIANISAVRDIFEARTIATATQDARRTMGRAALVRIRTETGMELKGDKQIIGVADSGLDESHPAFQPPTKILGHSPDDHDVSGHGTHVSGSIAGNHTIVRGVASKAKLFVQSRWNQELRKLSIPSSSTLLQTAYVNGARVHNNSWEREGQELPYSDGARGVDEFIWDHNEMVVCFAAGNQNGRIGAEAATKNGITVGATTDRRDGRIGVTEVMVQGQRFGPTSNLRHKPDVVAPGCEITSARSRHSPGEGDIRQRTGTSMATAFVSGAAAIVREALTKCKTPQTPSAALVKAILISGAEDLPRVSNRVNIANAVTFCVDSTWEVNKLRQGVEISYPVRNSKREARLKVALVWIDRPGETLQSELDLTVLVGNHPHRPPAPDDNVLVVRIEKPTRIATLKIQALRIRGYREYQEFALAWRWY